MIDYTFGKNKDYYAITNPKKKVHRIADIAFIVIDESLVKRLSINDETWFEQELTEDGILLKVWKKSD